MLKEVWQWWRTDCSPIARKLGYLSEAIALDARAERQYAMWEMHLAHSRAAIQKLANTVSNPKSVLVFGSGSLHDVPIVGLSEKFEAVYLVDIVHTTLAKEKASSFSNVHFIDLDFSFALNGLLRLPPNLDDFAFRNWQRTISPAFSWPKEISMVVSANCISQLPIKPIEWLQKNCPKLSEQSLNDFAWTLIRSHLELIKSFKTPVCLITDDVQVTRDASGEVIERTEYLKELNLQHHEFARWSWDIAPQGELPDDCSAVHTVSAIRL